MPEKTTQIEKLRARLDEHFEQAPEDTAHLRALLAGANLHEIADLLQFYDGDDKLSILRALAPDRAAEVLDEADETPKLELLDDLTVAEVVALVDHMPPDEATDLVDLLPEKGRDAVLSAVEADHADEIKELAEHDPESAGGLMTTEYVAIPIEATAGDALRRIQGAVDAEVVAYVYVIDENEKLAGVVSIRKLISSAPATALRGIMETDLIHVTAETDREHVAAVASLYDLAVVPVTDEEQKLLGVITIDDIVDVMEEEASEDMYRLAGTSALHPTQEAVLTRVAKRAPWLAITFVGGVLAVLILKNHGGVLRHWELMSFIPLLVGMQGNVGIQSSATILRGLATGEIDLSHVFRVFLREVAVGALIAILCGAAIGLIAAFWLRGTLGARVPLVIALAMFAGITGATVMGTLTPLVCHKIGVDPAYAAGPFVTTLNDVAGIVIFIIVGSLLLG